MSTNVIQIDDQKDKKDVLERSERARRNFTIISQDIYQKSGLSMEAMGVISYLMSLPPDWIVHVSHLRKVFQVGKNKILKVLKELVETGYMYRHQIRDNKGRIVGWETKYSDVPEFLESTPELHFRALDNRALENPALDKQPLQINNSTNKTIYKKTTQQKVIHNVSNLEPKQASQSQKLDSVVVVSLLENVQQWAIAEVLLKTWLKKYGTEYVLEKIEYTKAHSKTNPAGFLRKAVENNYQKHLADEPKVEQKPPVELIWPSHEENLTWYAGLLEEEKQKCFEQAKHKHPHFEEMLKIEKVNFKSVVFLKTTWFNMMMQLVGRAK